MSNFVTLTKEQFEENLPENFSLVDVPNCKEFVYHIPTSSTTIDVRIYSTVDMRTGVTRRIGSDAIRVVFWDKVNDRPVGKGKKILRVEGATSIGQRLQSRIEEFYNGASLVEVVNFDYVKAVLSHEAVSWSGFATSMHEQVVERGSLSDKQLSWVLGDKTPKGKKTFEAMVLAADPYFKDEWVSKIAEDDTAVEAFDPEPELSETTVEPDTSKFEEILHSLENLLPTKQYEYYKYPFREFNPVQSAVMPFRDMDCNLVIGANTSAGKTICAELLMDTVLDKGKRVIYLSPLKALTQEKYDDWQTRFKDYNITILTGDYTLSEDRKKELADAHIIVMTSEMCDSRTRRMKAEKNFWLKQVGLVVVDESHILSTDRGHAVEAGIMRFTAINKKARVLFLSATMPNCDELADWLHKLNGKSTEVVFSTWRPVELNMNYVEYVVATYSSGREDYWGTQGNKISAAIEIAMSKPDEKFLIFVHDKGTGRRIVKALEGQGEKPHFHNADLDLQDRLDVESQFSDRENGIRIMVSTSTLAWGRNLPARNVIIVGIHRGINEVDELDIIQMAGRAGRYGIDDKGFVYLLIPHFETGTWRKKFANPRPVKSVLDKFMPFHVIAEIETKTIQDSSSLLQWYGRSLASHQAGENTMSGQEAEAILNGYSQMEMIEGDGFRISPTGLGRVCAWLYFHPSDVYAWFKNFSHVFTTNSENDETLAWAIGDIPSNNMGYIPKPIQDYAHNFMVTLHHDYQIRATEGVVGAMALYHAITGSKEVPEALKSIKRQLVWDIDRINSALTLIDKQYALWNSDIWESLPYRVKYGVPEEIVPLTRINSVGGKRAKKLFNAGFTSVEDISKATIKNLCKCLTPVLAKKVKANAKAMLQ